MICLGEVILCQLGNKFPLFGTQRIFSMPIRACHWVLSWATLVFRSSLHTVLLWDPFSYHPSHLYLISHGTVCYCKYEVNHHSGGAFWRPCWWRQLVPLKCQWTSTRLHSVTCQKTEPFLFVTAERTSNPTRNSPLDVSTALSTGKLIEVSGLTLVFGELFFSWDSFYDYPQLLQADATKKA